MTASYPPRLACDDNTSIFCARVVRGMNSMLMALMPRSASFWTKSFSLNGSSRLTWMHPDLSSAISPTGGLRRRSTMSPDPNSALRSAVIVAPAAV